MKEGDIYMYGMFHDPNDFWRHNIMPKPRNDDEKEEMAAFGCICSLASMVVMFIIFCVLALIGA